LWFFAKEIKEQKEKEKKMCGEATLSSCRRIQRFLSSLSISLSLSLKRLLLIKRILRL